MDQILVKVQRNATLAFTFYAWRSSQRSAQDSAALNDGLSELLVGVSKEKKVGYLVGGGVGGWVMVLSGQHLVSLY